MRRFLNALKRVEARGPVRVEREALLEHAPSDAMRSVCSLMQQHLLELFEDHGVFLHYHRLPCSRACGL